MKVLFTIILMLALTHAGFSASSNYDIEIENVEEKPTMVVGRTVEVNKIGRTLGEIFPLVYSYVYSTGGTQVGHPVSKRSAMGV